MTNMTSYMAQAIDAPGTAVSSTVRWIRALHALMKSSCFKRNRCKEPARYMNLLMYMSRLLSRISDVMHEMNQLCREQGQQKDGSRIIMDPAELVSPP